MIGFHAKLAVDTVDVGGSVEFAEDGARLAGFMDADAVALTLFLFD